MTPDEIEFWERSTPVVFGSPEDHALHGAHSDRDGSEPKPYREAIRSLVDQSKAVATVERERDELRAALGRRGVLLKYLLDQFDRLVMVHSQVVMDTPEDRELHSRAVEAFRKAAEPIRAALKGGDDA